MQISYHEAQGKLSLFFRAKIRAQTSRAFSPAVHGNSSGVALIIVLFAVALVSIVVLAYFNLATLNRNISFSSAGQARANILALSALNFIKGDFIAEIQSGSIQEADPTGSSVPIYLPSTNSTMLPYRMTTNISPFDPTIPANLVKWSSGTYALWPATAAYNSQAGPIRASSGISSANATLNGHFIANSRWTKPDFGTNSTFPTKVVPEWVYMTRQGPLTNSIPAVSIATLANNSATNSNYVIGRYAYTVYDEGGLLDVAAAGYSPTTFTSDPTDIGRKGNQGFADLTQLGLTSAQADQLVGWRNASSWNSTNGYVGYLTTNAPATGFRQAATGDQAFLSRQDLIQYWTSELGTSTNLLQYVTTFSREKNAPSWGPEHNANDPNNSIYWNGTNVTIDPVNNPVGATNSLSYAYHDNQDHASVTVGSSTQLIYNRFFPNVRVTSAFVQPRLSGEQAVIGEPLVKNRFDLNKLSWITYNGVPPTGVTSADIYHYFGLTRNLDGSWNYNHTTLAPPSAPASQTNQIMTLDQVAAAGREPDFFELLQAVILQGSLGLCSGDPTLANSTGSSGGGGEFYRVYQALNGATISSIFSYEAPFARADRDATLTNLSLVYALEKYQVIQIGANMIDQYDSDNFPTDITLNGEHFYGVENLPFIESLGDTLLRPAPGAIETSPNQSAPDATFQDPNQKYVHRWMTVALWNPHQNAAHRPTVGPTSIRIAVTGGEECFLLHGLNPSTPTPPPETYYSGRIFEPAGSSVVPSGGGNGSGYIQGPSWIALKLSDYATEGNFAEPTPIDYNHCYTFDANNPGSANINNGYALISSHFSGQSPWQRAGIYMGWVQAPDNPYKVPLCAPLYPNYKTVNSPVVQGCTPDLYIQAPLTIELQYEDLSNLGTWHTYQTIRGAVWSRASGPGDSYMEPSDPGWLSWQTNIPPNGPYSNPSSTNLFGMESSHGPLLTNQESYVNNILDPRTPRSNAQTLSTTTPATPIALLTDNLGGLPGSQVLPGAELGPHFPKAGISKNSRDNTMYFVNNNTTNLSYYTDRDFIQRVGDAAGWTNGGVPSSPMPIGMQTQRPLHLDRPFRSIAELGYVFRDDPWKTLNLFSAKSADSGLPDVFYIGSPTGTAQDLPPPDIIAGKMNINSAARNSVAVNGTVSLTLQALLSAGLRNYLLTDPTTLNTSISTTDAATLASSIVTYIKANGPLINIGDLPAVFPQDTTVNSANPGLKAEREALVRALADSSGTRTWNLMIDVVAQAGKFSPTATNLNNFTVEGEKHYWLHVAIDRFTGEIIDQQLEPVWE